MATKTTAVDKKRKASSVVSKGKSGGGIQKKVKVEKKAVPVAVPTPSDSDDEDDDKDDEDDDFGGFSESEDGEDGGATLSNKKESKKASSGKPLEPGSTSRESHAKQKQLAQERKAAKPLADELQRAKKIWEKLRIKSKVPKEERQKLLDELFTIITGRMRDFVLKHDAVRAVQTAIKYSTVQQKREIALELKGAFPQLAESRYAKFMIGKLLVHNDEEVRDTIIPEFYGRVRKLINHSEASWILDDIYRTVATKEQKATMLREWYGPEFAIKELTKNTTPTGELKAILAIEPSKRGPIMKSLREMINSLVQKKMTGFTMLHDAMLQYYLNVQPGQEEFNEFFEMIKGDESGDLLKNMAFTAPGAKLSCLLLAHGSAKDRKQMLKTYKGVFLLMSGDQNAHTIILTAYDVIDDTKLTAKSIFPEVLGEKEEELGLNLVAAANNTSARKTILYLLDENTKTVFAPGEHAEVALLKEVHEIRKTTSKKDSDVRKKELIEAMSPSLLTAITAVAPDLVSTVPGCQIVAGSLLFGIGEKQAALDAVAQTAGGDPMADTETEGDIAPPMHVSRTAAGARMLKSLIQGGRFDKATRKVIPIDPPLRFSNILWPYIKEHTMTWATGTSSFVIVALMESDEFEDKDSLRKILKKNKKLLEKASTEETAEQKAWKEAHAQKEVKSKRPEKIGNMGSKILLEKL